MTLRAKGISHTATYDACADHVGQNACGRLQWKIATRVVPYVTRGQWSAHASYVAVWDIPLARKVMLDEQNLVTDLQRSDKYNYKALNEFKPPPNPF